MVTTRPMIRLSGFSRKTSFDGPSLSSSGCSSFSCPKRGSKQQLVKCDCDCGETNTLFRQQFLHQQQLLQQRQQQQRNHHLVLLQLQAQRNKKVQKHPQPPQIQIQQKRPIYVPHPPPTFRPTISDSNSESDREGLEHFHRHLQQLHRLTCASVENAIYFGGAGSSSNAKPSKTKSPKSFSFRDIRDIGKKKKQTNVNSFQQQQQQHQQQTPIGASSSSSSSPLSVETSKPLKRRNTTRSAKDYIGVSRVKLLAKYWNKGRSSGSGAGVDSGNGGSSSTSRSSDTSDSQLSNYSSGGSGVVVPAPDNKKNGSTATSSNANRVIISPRSSHKKYNSNNSNNQKGNNSTVTYKIRYDIPSSWESEQLLSFASATPDHHDNASKTKNKGSTGSTSSASCGSSSISSDEIRIRKKDAQFCNHCGRGPHSDPANLQPSPVASPKSPRTRIFKTLTFVRPPNQKPKEFGGSSSSSKNNTNEKRSGKLRITQSSDNLAVASSSSSAIPVQTMVQQKLALGRSKSQKCPERRVLVSQCETLNSKLAHLKVTNNNDSTKCLPKPKQTFQTTSCSVQNQQPKVRFKEQHHRSEAQLNDRSQEKHSIERASLLRRWTRRNSSSSTVTTTATNANMLPDEREFHSLYDNCRIPRPKLKGIVPTHSYGVCSSPISLSRCSSALGENRARRHAGNFMEFTEISLQDDDDNGSETSGFESEQNNAATTLVKKGIK
ncbi:hypothetical protein Ocin01_10916 [Orchesella cincta]|uniref:Uncharacterized protein n=1 Tax=Orchesella cincta TaxID=48709 RepID=A0A1D2MS91_ORCCI|nr:hypothetical protein Ocin01_10916 [Orchesella cincta]